MTKECELCTKRNTDYCPSPVECYETIDKPHYQNRIMLLIENAQLKEDKKIMGHNYTKYIQERDRRIQKAIDYINKHQEQKYNPSLVLADYELKELLKILETECDDNE